MNKAPFIGISRFRMGTDGHGVTTLVAFHGCPLRCRYCLNNQCLSPEGVSFELTPEELYKRVKKDELYFIATRGGITFGGGEPLLRAEYIKEVLELGAKKWRTTIETSLNVDRAKLELLLPYIDHYIVDIKDMNNFIYKRYTGKENDNVIQNLKWLVEQGKVENVTMRVPLIPGYNDDLDRERSIKELKDMGFRKFDLFVYRII